MTVKKYFLILAVVGLLLYLPSLSGPFLWDDEDFVYANQYVANFQIDKFFTQSQTAGRGKLSNYFRPVPQIVYAATHAVFGFNPFWYHLVNILVHISAACAVFYFFYILLNKAGDDWKNQSDFETRRVNFLQLSGKAAGTWVPAKAAESEKNSRAQVSLVIIPFPIALFFLIHPVQTEAVSYISGLSDPLFVLFGFLFLIYYLKNGHDRFGGGETNSLSASSGFGAAAGHEVGRLGTSNLRAVGPPGPKYFLVSLLFFALSLLSKETGLVFLGLLLALELTKQLPHDRAIIVWSKFPTPLAIFRSLTNLLTTLILSTWAYILIAFFYLVYHFSFINQFDIKAAWGNTPYAHSVVVRLLTFVQNLFLYVSLLVFPKDLFMERDYSIHIQTNLLNPFLIIFFLTNSAIIFFLRRIRSTSYNKLQPSYYKLLVFCYLAFFISFIPYSGLILINGIFYEHFLYLPMVFFTSFAILSLNEVYEHFVATKTLRIGAEKPQKNPSASFSIFSAIFRKKL